MKTTRQNGDLKSAHITPADGNVFADLGFSPKRAKAMLADADARIAKSRKLKLVVVLPGCDQSGVSRYGD